MESRQRCRERCFAVAGTGCPNFACRSVERSEFRFLELKESKTPPLPQFSITRPRESQAADDAARIVLAEHSAPHGRRRDTTRRRQQSASELRFVQPPQAKSAANASSIKPANARTECEPIGVDRAIRPSRPDCPPNRRVVPTAHRTVCDATTYATECGQAANRQRPWSTSRHRCRSMWKLKPVRAVREAAPTYTPPGTELFVAAAPKKWDLPALDYGSALRQVQPPQRRSSRPSRSNRRGSWPANCRSRRPRCSRSRAAEPLDRAARRRRRNRRCETSRRVARSRLPRAQKSRRRKSSAPIAAAPRDVAVAPQPVDVPSVAAPSQRRRRDEAVVCEHAAEIADGLGTGHVARAGASPRLRRQSFGEADRSRTRCCPRIASCSDRDVHLGAAEPLVLPTPAEPAR